MTGMGGMNSSFPMNPMMAMGGMQNMMSMSKQFHVIPIVLTNEDMGMDPMMMNAMANSMFGNFGAANMGMNGMNGMGMPNQQNWYQGANNGMGNNNRFQGQNGAVPPRTFQRQQQSMGGEDDAYMRKPVNPNRRKGPAKVRPTDYRELG